MISILNPTVTNNLLIAKGHLYLNNFTVAFEMDLAFSFMRFMLKHIWFFLPFFICFFINLFKVNTVLVISPTYLY